MSCPSDRLVLPEQSARSPLRGASTITPPSGRCRALRLGRQRRRQGLTWPAVVGLTGRTSRWPRACRGWMHIGPVKPKSARRVRRNPVVLVGVLSWSPKPRSVLLASLNRSREVGPGPAGQNQTGRGSTGGRRQSFVRRGEFLLPLVVYLSNVQRELTRPEYHQPDHAPAASAAARG